MSHITLDELLADLGAAGAQLHALGACEGAAGNLSVCVADTVRADRFTDIADYPLPLAVPELAGHTLIVTGAGCRLRDVAANPHGTLAVLHVHPGGHTATLHTHPARQFTRPTSEFNSHLGVHQYQWVNTRRPLSAVAHAQPRRLTFLSHIPAYRQADYLNARLLRWQPETVIQFPQGMGVLPYLLPGSAELMQASAPLVAVHRLVIWSQHGVLAHSPRHAVHAADLIDYAEAAAHYEVLDLHTGQRADGLPPPAIADIARVYG